MPDSREPDTYLIAHVQDALAADPRLNELTIDVSLRGAEVFLSGVVATAERQQAVGEVVAAVLPEHRVHNEVSVMDYAEPDRQETIT